jgi:NAD(P)-dependent dehydrogenase (short-subunit alcohol dehydrogenase family)
MPTLPERAPIDLAGRVILITGATGGLGAPLARACAAAGATVVLHGRVVRKLEALYDDIVAAGHPEPAILPLDLAQAEAADYANALSAVRAQLHRLDGVVHTAVHLGSLGPIEHQPFDTWQKVLRVNVAAAAALTRAAMPLLDAAPDAAVIVTLDDHALAPRAYWGAYGAAKAALAALAATLADEWENRAHLRACAVVPGPVRSPLRTLTHPGEDKAALRPIADLVPLYLGLLGGADAARGVLIDGRAWLAGQAATSPLITRAPDAATRTTPPATTTAPGAPADAEVPASTRPSSTGTRP